PRDSEGRAAHAGAGARGARSARGRPPRVPGGEPPDVRAGVRRVRRHRALSRVRRGARLRACRANADLPCLRARDADAGDVPGLSRSPEHYVFDASARQDLGAFYRQEMKFRGELGYPPFRRLAIVTVTAPSAAGMRRLGDEVAAALTSAPALTVYPPATARRDRARRIVVKGHADLATRLAEALGDFRRPRPKSRGIIDVEVDPVEWPS